MIFSDHFNTRSLFILLSLLAINACSLTTDDEQEDDLFIKPKELVLKKSIIAKNKNNSTDLLKSDNIIELESEKITPKQTVEKLANVGGLSTLEKKAKVSPVFSNDTPVTISVDSMSTVEFIHYVFDEILGLNYVISSKVENDKNTVSLNLTEPVSKDVLYTTAQALLDDNKIAMLRKENIIYFQEKEKNKRYTDSAVGIGNSLNDIPKTSGQIIQIIPYIHTNSRSLTSVIKKLTGIDVSIDSNRKLITVEGNENDISEVMRVLKMLDVASASGKEIRLISLAYIAPDTLVERLGELLANDGYAVGKNQDITIVPMPRLNSIVVYAVSLEAVERVELWSEKLDVAVAGDEPQFYIYRPLYNKAIDIQNSLGTIISSILGEQFDNDKKSADSTDKLNNVSAKSSVGMTVDESQNALIFYTTAKKYRKILLLLENLDQLPGQVILDIVIAEITLNDKDNSNIDWNYNSNGITTADGINPSTIVELLSGGTSKITGINGDWRAVLNIIKQKSKTRILSKPFLIVKDGESATINAGDRIPTLTQSSTSENDNITNSVQYVSTGITVGVTPTINAKGLINLEVSMASSNAPDADSSLTPIITNRSISTNIFSADGQTVALGGLIKEDLDRNNNKVPFLGDLPLIGRLFSSKSNDYVRTELMMLITTRTIKKINDIDELVSRTKTAIKKKEIIVQMSICAINYNNQYIYQVILHDITENLKRANENFKVKK